MLGGSLDWVSPLTTPAPAPPPSRSRRRSPSPPPRRHASPSEQPPFRPAPLPVRYRTPPKARKKKRRIVHVEEPSYDEPQRGDLRERVETVQRRPPVATGAGLDPMIAQASAPRPKPRPDNVCFALSKTQDRASCLGIRGQCTHTLTCLVCRATRKPCGRVLTLRQSVDRG